MSDRHHTQLSLDERIQIQKGIENGKPFNAYRFGDRQGPLDDLKGGEEEQEEDHRRIPPGEPALHAHAQEGLQHLAFMRQAMHEDDMQGMPINLQSIMPRIQPRSLRAASEAAVCMQCLQAPRRMPEGQVLL